MSIFCCMSSSVIRTRHMFSEFSLIVCWQHYMSPTHFYTLHCIARESLGTIFPRMLCQTDFFFGGRLGSPNRVPCMRFGWLEKEAMFLLPQQCIERGHRQVQSMKEASSLFHAKLLTAALTIDSDLLQSGRW